MFKDLAGMEKSKAEKERKFESLAEEREREGS